MVLNLAALPSDLLLEVISCLPFRSDVLSLTLSNKELFTKGCAALYSHVHLHTTEQCRRTLLMLHSRPDVARHVQKLQIRFASRFPTYLLADIDGVAISGLLRELAPKLDVLHTFIWDADEIPHCDDMWFALRMSCPRLRTIGTCYGSVMPDEHSHLLEFKNLCGFSLTLKNGYYIHHADKFQDTLPFEGRLWDMLIRNSPNLEELHILGGPLIADGRVHPLCSARWPLLHSLSLGDIILDWSSSLSEPGSKRPFIAFLEAHQRLRSLRTSPTALSPHLLPSLAPTALPHLTHFVGSLEHLQGLASFDPKITHLAIEESLIIRDFAPLLVTGVLQNLRCLTELRVAFIFHSYHESGNLIRSLANACPGLTTLEITCAKRPSLTVDTLAKSISVIPRLRHLRLTLVPSAKEHPLRVCASQIAHAIPRLNSFSLTFIPSWLSPPRTSVSYGLYDESGTYVIRPDEHGHPHSLNCTERRPALRLPFRVPKIPLPLVLPRLSFSYFASRSPFLLKERRMKTQHFVLDLRPGKHRNKGLGVILEGSTAGEEVRMLVVLAALSGLALWGFFG